MQAVMWLSHLHGRGYADRVDPLVQAWTWVAVHPAETAWAIFGALSAMVAVYRLKEAEIKARVAATSTKADDKLVAVLDSIVAVFEVIKLFVPHGIAKPKEPKS